MNWTKVIEFWFTELSPGDWFRKSEKIDTLIRDRFGDLHRAVALGLMTSWRTGPLGSLAEAAIAKDYHQPLSNVQKSFLYMPFMHSESGTVHQRAVELFSQPGLEGNLNFELKHKKIIDRFGRYPHRNSILGRVSTPEELEFQKTSPGF